MEGIVGSVLALVLSLGYTEIRMRKHKVEYDELVEAVEVIEEDAEDLTDLKERVDVMEQNLGRNMLAAMMPMSKAIKELKETVGME